MSTGTLNTIIGIALPLIAILIAGGMTALWQWSSTTTTAAKAGSLQATCETAVKAFVHLSLQQGQLLTSAQHLPAVLGLVNQIAPGWPSSVVTPIVQAIFHDINTTTLQTEAQRTTAAASTPTVIAPNPVEVAQALIKTLSSLGQVPASAPPAVTPTPSPLIVPPSTAAVSVKAGTS